MSPDQYNHSMNENARRTNQSSLLANTFSGKVHTAQDETRLAQCLEVGENLNVYKQYREYGNHLQGKPGSRVLDIGCGIGDTCRKLAKRVGERGEVVGLDASQGRLKTAKRLTEQNPEGRACENIKWVQGTAEKLPFPDASFNGVRVERTLQHIKNAQLVVKEVSRVLAADGTFIAVDPDWRQFKIESSLTNPGVTKSILDFWMSSFACGDITERMPEWLAGAGLDLSETKTFWLNYDNSYYLAEILFDLTRLAPAAAEEGVVSRRDATSWLKSLKEADRSGLLKWSMPLKLFHAKR